jgi:hypothetical protein
VPIILSVESHATTATSNESAKTAQPQVVNGSNCEKEQVYTKRLACSDRL